MPKTKVLKDKSIVITGTSSFKGMRVLKALEEDPRYTRIVALDKKKPSIPLKKTVYYKFDLTETLADVQLAEILKKEKCDTLVHCAVPITPPKNESYAHELISIGTMYITNACAEAKVRKIILSSTTDVYGANPDNPNFLHEDLHTPNGRGLSRYLVDKIEAENTILKYGKRHPGSIVTILRPCSILGPTIESYKTRFFKRFFITSMMGFDPLFQFLHEDDMVRAFLLAIEKDANGVFNIVGDGVLPLSRVIKILGKIKVPLPQIGFKSMVQILWFLDMAPAPASHVNFLRYLCIADGSKAKKELGFVPRFSTKEALLSFIGAERLREVNLIQATP
ncbi:NAD-dependent epimerase/dehydratase family protein [bacterium]|nr:NAD-dependent epimerase/dehydratase family protein [bacterium]